MRLRPDLPYNDLPLLPPKADIETKSILKACIVARASLAELRVSGQLIPNQSILINSIPLMEAQASSEIENIVTTTDRLFRFANEPAGQADPATKEALRYRTALNEGFHSLKERPVSTSTAVAVCRRIKGVDLDIRSTPGTALMNEVSGPEQYSPIVPFESSPGAAAAGLPGRVIADTPSDGREGDFGDQAEGDDHDPGSASAGADGVGHFQRNGHRPQDGAQIHRARP